MSFKKFAISALLLMLAGLVVRVLGFVYRIFLSNTIGAEGVGLYQLVTPLYSMIVLTLTAGISITGSRMIAARYEKDHDFNPNKIVVAGLALACAGGAIASLLLLFFANVIANNIIGDPRTLISVKILIPCIPVVATAAAFKGYFYGIQRVGPAAIASVVEQITRIGVVAALASSAKGMGIEYVCAVAVAAAAIGEAANLIVLFFAYPVYNRKHKKKGKERLRTLTGEMFRGTVPISANRLVISAAMAVETIMIPQFIALGGIPYKLALEEFGRMAGMAMPLIFFPSLVTSSLSTALVAEISGNMATGKNKTVNARISKSIGITFMMGLLFSCIFLAMPNRIGDLAFKGMGVGNILSMLAFSATFLYLQQTLMGVLNGLGRQTQVLIITLVGYAIRIGCICVLVPRTGVFGYAIGMFVSGSIVCVLCLWDVSKSTGLKMDFMNWLMKPLIAALAIWCLAPFTISIMQNWLGNSRISTLASVGACCLEYIAFLLMLGMRKYLALRPIRKYNKDKPHFEGVESNENTYT